MTMVVVVAAAVEGNDAIARVVAAAMQSLGMVVVVVPERLYTGGLRSSRWLP